MFNDRLAIPQNCYKPNNKKPIVTVSSYKTPFIRFNRLLFSIMQIICQSTKIRNIKLGELMQDNWAMAVQPFELTEDKHLKLYHPQN